MTDLRRRLLVSGCAAAAAAVAGSAALLWRRSASRSDATAPSAAPSPPADDPFAAPLRIPVAGGLLGEIAVNGALTMVARQDDFSIFPGSATPLWHYSARSGEYTYANPLLRVQAGEMLDVTLRNELAEDTTIHWHGLLVDEANDGSGLHPVAPGAQANYRFGVRNRAGLYWYHAHPHGRTGLQVQRGLAGLLLVEDDEERALREALSLPWGERDLPLLIADKQVDDTNAIVYREHGADDWIGNRVLVNWTPQPHLDVTPALYRFRIANVANARMWRLAFQYRGRSLPFQLIGTDGGLLERPWPVEDLFLAPAQRADVLVDFAAVPAGERVLLRSLDYVAMENEDESGAFAPDPMGDHPGAMPMGAALDVMEFRVAATGAVRRESPLVPAQLSAPAPLPDTSGWPTRALRLRMDSEGTWFINEWNFHKDGHEPAFRIRRGSREVWEIRNSMTSMPHPVHLHGFVFRVLSRRVSPMDLRARQVADGGLTAQDLGWTDTVVVWPGEVVRIAIDFSQPYSGVQRYMFHCHNLEHEDMGMMMTFAVTD